MTQDVTNPHDSFFKAVFGSIERSRQFFRFYLPDKPATELDQEQLQLEKGSFVDEQLRRRHSDLLLHSMFKFFTPEGLHKPAQGQRQRHPG